MFMGKSRDIYENAIIKRTIQYVHDGSKKEENLVYSIEVELNEKPLIITVRIGKEFMDATVTDKKTGKMLEYVAQKGNRIEGVRNHNLTMSDVKKMLELPKS